MSDKTSRLDIANAILQIISSHGRRFFFHEGRVSQFEIDPRGRVWFTDGYTQKRIFTSYRRGRWKGFTEGGTLRNLVENLHDHIANGSAIRSHFGPWPQTLCDGDLWGYGDSMVDVRLAIGPLLDPGASDAKAQSPQTE